MIIYTTPEIEKLLPTKISSIVSYGGRSSCLAEVADTFNLSQEEIDKNEIGFWWAVRGLSFIDTEQWDYEEKYKGGLVEGIEWIYSLSKENNIAVVINSLANNAAISPFELWESAIQ